jgi:polysaccharide biosynthesis transport protein
MASVDNGFPLQSEYSYPSGGGGAVDIWQMLWALRQGWLFPVFGCLIGLALAIFYIVSVPTPYKSSARILLDRSLNRYLQTNKVIDEPALDDDVEIASQVYLLSSDSVIVPVVRSMNLGHDSEFVGRSNTQTADGDAKIDSDVALERIAVEAVNKRLTISREDVANVISVTFESEDPNKAAAIANAIADRYISTTLDNKLKSSKIVTQWLQDRLDELKTQAMDADRALQDYKIANNLVSTDRGSLNAEQLANLNTQLTNARVAVADAKARLDRIQQLGPDAITNVATINADNNPTNVDNNPAPSTLNNADIVTLRTRYRELAAKAAEIEALVGPTHLAVIKLHDRMAELRAEIRDEEKRIADSYVSDFQIASAREREIAATVAQSVGQLETNGQAQAKARELESSADALHNLYNSFLQKFKEINTIQSQTIPIQSASIITRATPALHKSFKKAAAVLGGSVLFGLFLGAGTALAREWAAGVFRSPKGVEQVTNLHCVVLPKIDAKRFLAKQTPVEEYVLDAPYSRFTETLREVKALINAAGLERGAKVIGVVSSVSNEGKTTVAANLAALMIASSGAQALVIDADLHMRRLTAKLAPEALEGLIQALDDPSRLAKLVRKRPRSGLDILPCAASTRVPNAAELLGSPKMERLLIATRKAYDYIILEIAPIMSVVDLKMMERFIDGFIFVIEWGQTKRALVLEALSEVPAVRERLIGVVLNKADPGALKSIEAYKGSKFGDYYQE